MSKPPIALEARKSEEARLFSPSAGRNKADISTALAEILPVGASVLEIGSGTGEHGIATVKSPHPARKSRRNMTPYLVQI